VGGGGGGGGWGGGVWCGGGGGGWWGGCENAVCAKEGEISSWDEPREGGKRVA